MATLTPNAANSCAVAAPIPRDPPVTRAFLPLRSIMRRSRCPVPCSLSQSLVDQIADDVLDAEVQLLRAIGPRGRDHDTMSGELREGSAVTGGETQHVDALGLRGLSGLEDIW